jgi:hypothetical protein
MKYIQERTLVARTANGLKQYVSLVTTRFPGVVQLKRCLSSCAIYGVVGLLILYLWRTIIISNELLLSSDILVPIDMPAFRSMFFPFWNRILEFPNVETIDRLVWMAPFLLLPDPLIAQKLMIAVALVGAGWSMLLAARRLGAPVMLAVLAGVLYAYNPWVADRLQHYFLLPGYAVMPLVLSLWLKPARGSALLIALLMTLGATTPHYTVFMWALSGLWLLFPVSVAALRRFAVTFGLYAMFNVYWLVPTALFMLGVDLVPSYPTWEMEALFSRNAEPAAIMRLQGYWWPLVEVMTPPFLKLFGLGLVLSALIGLTVRPDRSRFFLASGALIFSLLALGTAIPWLVQGLVLEGPFAERLGWLFRDPNKAVGPLASLLLLLAATGIRHDTAFRLDKALTSLRTLLLIAYGVFSLSVTGPYIQAAYEPHSPPEAFHAANRWLERQPEGRALWLPRYHGARTFWNGRNMTPEFATHSSSRSVLGPYNYNERSVVAYHAIYFGGLLGDVAADVEVLLRGWGTRWLVHHRDVLPYRLQDPLSFDNRIELLQPGIQYQRLNEAYSVSPLTIYDAGEPLGSYHPSRVYVSENPLAALLTLSNWASLASDTTAFVETPHEGVHGLALLPGDDPYLLLAENAHAVDLARGTMHHDPARHWSRLNEASLEWWPNAVTVGLPPAAHRTLLTTHRAGARLQVATRPPAGTYRMFLRAYQGLEAGAVRLQIAGTPYTIDLSAPTARSAWLELGEVSTKGQTLDVEVANLYGRNTLTDFRLVPTPSWNDAKRQLEQHELLWMWPSSTFCKDQASVGAEPVVILEDAQTLPVSRSWEGGALWAQYGTVSLEVHGEGDLTPVELWTKIRDTWIFLGGVRTWWQGWRTVTLPLKATDFVFVPGATQNLADNLKIIVAAEHTGEEAVRVQNVRLGSSLSCALSFTSPRETTALLSVSSRQESLGIVVNGEHHVLTNGAAVPIALQAGENTVEVANDLFSKPQGVMIATEPLHVDEPDRTPLAASSGGLTVACSDEWRLAVAEPLYLAGKHGTLAGENLEPVAVNYLRQGYWVPPGTCGQILLHNIWETVGWSSMLVSVLALLGVIVHAVIRRQRRNQ